MKSENLWIWSSVIILILFLASFFISSLILVVLAIIILINIYTISISIISGTSVKSVLGNWWAKEEDFTKENNPKKFWLQIFLKIIITLLFCILLVYILFNDAGKISLPQIPTPPR